MIIHHMTPDQADSIAQLSATPVEREGKLEWEVPRWAVQLVASAKAEPQGRRCWHHNIQDYGTETTTPQR